MQNKETLDQLLSAPLDFLHGLIGGLFGPLLALAGTVGLIYALTQKLPALKKVAKSNGDQHTAIILAPSLEARASWARYGGELRSILLALKANLQK